DVEEIARGLRAQPVDVEGGRLAVAAPHDHAVPAAQLAVAGSAVDTIAVLAPLEELRVDGHGYGRHEAGPQLAGLHRRVPGQMAAGHGARHPRPGGAVVTKEFTP